MSPTVPPRVTVLLPVFNGGPHLGPAITSILGQTMTDFELLVLDDGSTDGSDRMARSYPDPRIRVIGNARQRGLTTTLNLGLREARAELIARQDADDVSAPSRLELQVAEMARRPDLALLGAQAVMIDDAGRYAGDIARGCDHDTIRWELLFDNAFVHSSVMFRRSVVVDALGGYDEGFRYCQDYELWCRLVRRYRAANLGEVLVQCRTHARSMTATGGFENVRESEAAVAANIRATLGEAIEASDVPTALQLRIGLRRAQAARFAEVFERMLRAYQRLRPGVAESPDFRQSVARQLVTALRASRLGSLSVVRRALAAEAEGFPVLRQSVREVAAWFRTRAPAGPR